MQSKPKPTKPKSKGKPKVRLSIPSPPLTRSQILTQALTLWLMDMATLPLSYTSTPEFRRVFKHYYSKFTHDIRLCLMQERHP